ncbi:hypothetical protein Btru_074561 [Bulinus truncatus]|nr:hypothetical protein Btru_074561 [Bulinus truncatus]
MIYHVINVIMFIYSGSQYRSMIRALLTFVPTLGLGVDCQVGEWEEWTECDNPCGYGSRKRKRVVTQYPDNGGNHCPVLKQRRACVGFEEEVCKQNLVNEMTIEKAEQARILPIEFGRFRTEKKYDPWKGILKNLYNKYFNEILTRPSPYSILVLFKTKEKKICSINDTVHYLFKYV